MARLRYNGLATGSAGSLAGLALGASLTSGATAVTFNAALTHSNGTAVPTIVSPDYIPLQILDSNGHLSEIVWLTAYTAGATTGTIVRGCQGTTGVAHSSGDKVIGGPTVPDLPAVRGSNAAVAAATSVSVTIPAATQAGDLLIAFTSSGFPPSTTPPSGWQLLGYHQGATSFEVGAAYSRVAQAGDASASASFSFSGSYTCGGVIVAVSGAASVQAVEVTDVGTGTATSLQTNTAGGGADLLTLAFAGVRQTGGTTTSSYGSSIATSTSGASEGCVVTAFSAGPGDPAGIVTLTHSITAKAIAGAVVKIRGAQ